MGKCKDVQKMELFQEVTLRGLEGHIRVAMGTGHVEEHLN